MDLNKLPKWAQEEFARVKHERDTVVRALREYCDNQTVSNFYIDEYKCTGEKVPGSTVYRRYIQTNKISVYTDGVYLDVIIIDRGILIQWGKDEFRTGEVAFIPQSYQSAELVSQDSMR